MPQRGPPLPDRAKECPPSTWRSQSYTSRAQQPTARPRPLIKHYRTDPIVRQEDTLDHSSNSSVPRDSRSSVSTYASTISSEGEDGQEDHVDDEALDNEHPPSSHQVFSASTAVPSSPHEFADFFPSTRRLRIRHDDCSVDNDMNLRVDTQIASSSGRPRDLILFHLRMQDVHAREYSLRRYCRESGREVCHSKRKAQQNGQSGLKRSLSSVLGSLNPISDPTQDAGLPLKRQDSGYHSIGECDSAFRRERDIASSAITLEFSNYACVDVRRGGIGRSNYHQFEFWGRYYSWKRKITRSSTGEEASFQLYRRAPSKSLTKAHRSKPIAHILPDPMSPHEAYEEGRKKNWIPPCSMWISDTSILGGLTDVADVVVATGLVALVDYHSQRRWCKGQ